MEQAEFGEERSSNSEPLDPEDETLIWSAGSFLDPSPIVKRLRKDFDAIVKRVNVRWLGGPRTFARYSRGKFLSERSVGPSGWRAHIRRRLQLS